MSGAASRRAKMFALSLLLATTALCLAARASGEGGRATRTITGMVYFTNNSPDVYSFPVELFDSSKRRRVAATRTERDSGYFEITGLRPGKYYLQVSIGPRCLLQYEVDARRRRPEHLRLFGDAGCGRHQIPGLPAPRPVPPNKKR